MAISDVTKLEGHRGNTDFTFTLTLSSASTNTVTVNFATADGAAISSGSNKDYTATSGTLTFNPGEISKTITVSIKGDTKVELDETFFVNLSSPTNAILADGQGVGTIRNDDGVSPTSMSAFAGTDSSSPTASSIPALQPVMSPTPASQTTSTVPALQPATSPTSTVAPRGAATSSDTAGVAADFASMDWEMEVFPAFHTRWKKPRIR